MGLITWIIFGAIAGYLASIIADTNAEQGMVGNILVGIAGAFIGGLISHVLSGSGITGFNLGSLLLAVLGSVILLFIVRGARREHPPTA